MRYPLRIKKQAQLTGHRSSVFALAPGPTEHHLLSAGGEGWLVRWDLRDPEVGKVIAQVETQVFSLCPIWEEEVVVAGNMHGGIHWVDLRHPDRTRNVAHHRKGVFALLRVGDHLYSGGGQGLLTRWSVGRRRSLESLQLSSAALRAIDYHPGRHELAVGASDRNIYLLDADTLEVRATITDAHDNSVFTVRYLPGADLLFSGGRDAHLKSWDLTGSPQCLSAQPAHWFTVNDIACPPDGAWLATASRDKTIKIWDPESLTLQKVLDVARDGGHLNSVNCLYWADHHRQLISAGDDRSIILWDGWNDASRKKEPV